MLRSLLTSLLILGHPLVNCAPYNLLNENYELLLLHTNDCHARIQQSDKYSGSCSQEEAEKGECYGGVARRHTKIQELKAENENVLLLDGGDQYQGTTWFYYYKGAEAWHFMNMLGYDAMAIGNHEFDNGVSGLRPFLVNATFDVLSSNIDASKEPLIDGLYDSWVTKEVGGRKIGIVGYTTTDTEFLVDPAGISNLEFLDEVEQVQQAVEEMQAEDIDIIIALGHAGFDTDVSIAENVDGVDVVIGGHSNTFLYTGEPPDIETPAGDYPHVVTQSSGRKVLCVQDYAYGKYLGELHITFDDDGEIIDWDGNPILLDSSIEEDPRVLTEVQTWYQPLYNFTQEELGTTYVFLNGDSSRCRRNECNMGNLIVDAIVYEHLYAPIGDKWSHVSIALWNGGGIRSSIQMGSVSLEHVLQVLPFRNTVSLVKLKGSTIIKMLEYSVENFSPENTVLAGKFLQISGIRVVYDLSRPNNQRVVSVMVKCHECDVPIYEDLDEDTVYPVLTSSFLITGGDGYTMIEEEMIEMEDLGTDSADVLADYIKSKSPIVYGEEQRIQFTEVAEGTTCAGTTISLPVSLILASVVAVFRLIAC